MWFNFLHYLNAILNLNNKLFRQYPRTRWQKQYISIKSSQPSGVMKHLLPSIEKILSNISPNGRIFKNQPSLMKTIDSLENLQVKVNRQIMKTTNKMLYSLRTFDKLTPSTKLVNLSWSCDTLFSLNITASTN